MRKRIYIAGPMSQGDKLANLNQALVAYRELLQKGYAPLCPQLAFFVDTLLPFDWQTWIDADLPWVSVADAVLRLPGASEGADAEVRTANAAGTPVFNNIGRLLEIMPA